MSMKIITPLRPRTFSDFESAVALVDQRADILEVWIDALEDPYDFFDSLCQSTITESYQLLGVCKTPEEHGEFKGNSAEKNNLMHEFLRSGGTWIDLDVTRNPYPMIASLPPEKLWLSFHDFEGVSSEIEIALEGMKLFQPLGIKFAVTTNSQADLETFLQFVLETDHELKSIFTTMGTKGLEGRERIGSHSWAQFYALSEADKTADGQKTLDEL